MSDIGNQLRGAAALAEMLDCIGGEGVTDHDVAKLLTDNELDLRELLSFAIRKMIDEK
jgi:hypothetical protein